MFLLEDNSRQFKTTIFLPSSSSLASWDFKEDYSKIAEGQNVVFDKWKHETEVNKMIFFRFLSLNSDFLE